MGFVRYDERFRLVDGNGEPLYIVGINYVANYICTNFWEDWRPDVIEKDLARISELGLNAIRIPMFWGYMEPEEGKYNPDIFPKFNLFLEWCRIYNLYVMPWFLVGVATKDYDVPFRGGRPFFSGDMVDIAADHLRHFIAEYKDEEQILFWDICDEPEFYSRHKCGAEQLPYDRKVFAKWVQAMYTAVKSVDQNHLVTLAFGHIASSNYGMHVKEMAEILDFMVVTCYPGLTCESLDSYRNNYFVTYNVAMNKIEGKPVFTCEAPGFTELMYSEEIIGRYFKASVYSNLIQGSAGVMPWVFNDFDESIWYEDPFDKYPGEPYFGIVTTDGKLKKSGKELKRFAKFAKDTNIATFAPQSAEVAILLPPGYYDEIDVTLKKIYASFILAKGCGVDVDCVWHDSDFSKYKLLIISASSMMTTTLWREIIRYVENGGNIYYSGNVWNMSVKSAGLFGVEVQYQEKDFDYDALDVKEKWGSFEEGQTLQLHQHYGNYVNVKPTTAQILCSFADGTPALVLNKFGKGTACLSVKSLEDGLMDIKYADFINHNIYKIYDALIDYAGVTRSVRCNDHRIEIGCLTDNDNHKSIYILVNHDLSEVNTRLYLDGVTKSDIYDYFKDEYIIPNVDDSGNVYIDATFEPIGVKAYIVNNRV